MNFEEIRKLTELLKTLKAIRNQQEIMAWLREHRELLREMSEEDREKVREAADYDDDEWQTIVRQLFSDE